MIVPQVPTHADGGFWWVVRPVEVITDGQHAGWDPGVGDGWQAWIAEVNGTMWAAVRSPDPAVVRAVSFPSVDQVLAAAGLAVWPHGRLRGR